MKGYTLVSIGIIRSELKTRAQAPRFSTEGAPDAFLELKPAYRRGMSRIRVGDGLIVITWLHRARRDVLRVHPQGNATKPLTGVFLTRSPDRPNPLGLHRVTVREVRRAGPAIPPTEALDGTPGGDLTGGGGAADDRGDLNITA